MTTAAVITSSAPADHLERPSGASGFVGREPRLSLLRYEPDPDRPPPPPPATTQTRRPLLAPVAPADAADALDVRRRVEGVLRLALEVLDGRRPIAQLAPHLDPSAVRYMRAALARRPPLREPSRMTSLHVSRPHTDVAEIAVVYRRGPRARALAARFERLRPGRLPARVPRAGTGRRDTDGPGWRCVTLRLL